MSELESAVERWRKGYQGDEYGFVHQPIDSHTLANAYIAHLDQQAAEARDRALPVDADWLRPLCERIESVYFFLQETACQDLYLVRHAGGFNLKSGGQSISENATRGHVLDVIKLFKPKEQP